jgi:molecular chaperone DnaK (HSP70)
MVAAIDFGTTYSGYAYCRHSDFTANRANPTILGYNWNSGEFLNYKAPTCVLFNPDKTFHSFGYDAINYYLGNIAESGVKTPTIKSIKSNQILWLTVD